MSDIADNALALVACEEWMAGLPDDLRATLTPQVLAAFRLGFVAGLERARTAATLN